MSRHNQFSLNLKCLARAVARGELSKAWFILHGLARAVSPKSIQPGEIIILAIGAGSMALTLFYLLTHWPN